MFQDLCTVVFEKARKKTIEIDKKLLKIFDKYDNNPKKKEMSNAQNAWKRIW